MFLIPITAQEKYLTGFLTTLPLLVVVTETADSLVETPEAGTETMPLDGWLKKWLVLLKQAFWLVLKKQKHCHCVLPLLGADAVTGWLKTPQMVLLGMALWSA